MKRTRVILVTGVLLVLFGCSADADRAEPARENENEPGGDDIAGGTTGDFSGDKSRCDASSELAPDDDSVLGFSPQSVLDFSLGRYEIPLRWGTGCESAQLCSSERQCTPTYDSDPTGLLGTETTFAIELEPSDRRASAAHPSEPQPDCAESMRIPVRMSLTSADGALNERAIETELSTEWGTTADIHLERKLSSLEGALGSDGLGLPDSATLSLSFGFYRNQVWLETYVVPKPAEATGAEDTLLTDLLLPADECVLELPRASVDQTDPSRRTPERPAASSDAD